MCITISRRWLLGIALIVGALGASFPAAASALGAAPIAKESAPEAAVPPPAPTIATVDLEEVLKGLKEREDKEKALKQSQDDYQKRIYDMAEEAKTAKAKLEQEPDGPGKIAMAKQVREKMLRAGFEKDYAEKVLGEMKGEMLRDLYKKINDTIQKLAKQNNYQLVLADDSKAQVNSSDPESVLRAIALKRILFVDPALDITNDVVQLLNNQYAAGPTTGSAPAPAPTPAPIKPAPKKP